MVTSTISPTLQISLRLFAVWPDVPYGDVRRMFYVLSLVILQYFQYLYIYETLKYGQMENLIESLPTTLYYTLTTIKMITLWKYHRVFREVLAIMETDWRECVEFDHLHIMTTKANISNFWSHGLLILNSIAGLLYFGGENALSLVHMLKGNNVTSRLFPLRVVFPSTAEQSPIYELLVFIMFLHGMSTIFIVNTLSGLILTLVLHVSGQIEIICQQLKNIPGKLLYHGSRGFPTGMLIDRHNKVITFSENVDKLFSFIALMQVFGNIFVVCSVGLFFLISPNEAGVGLFKSIFAYAGITAEIFTFCFVGEYLGIKSKSLGDAGYESLWYNMSPTHSKNILLMIMRSQKQLTITAGGMTDLSLEAFTSIMKASASYMSILNAMY